MRQLSVVFVCAAALCAPAAASAQQPAPLRMALITAGIDPGAAAALDRVIAASPLIERLSASAPPVEDTDAARAAWLRANKLEGSILASQAGDKVALTAVGPRGEILGRVALAVSADDAEAQRALQRAAGLIGPPVLRYRAERPAAEPPVAEPPVEPPAEPATRHQEPLAPPGRWDDPGLSVTLGALYSPLYLATLKRTPTADDPQGDYTRSSGVGGLSLQLGPSRADQEATPIWLDVSLQSGLAELPNINMGIFMGAMLSDRCEVCYELGGGLRFNYVGAEVGADMMLLQLELLGAGLRWYTGLGGLVLRAFMAGGPAFAPMQSGFGMSLTGVIELRYVLKSQLYLEFVTPVSQGFVGADRFFITGGALGIGVIF